MNSELTVKLYNEFPKIWMPLSEDIQRYSLCVGDGWYDLLRDLCKDLSEIELPEDFQVVQVKEKFGGLRFYCDGLPYSGKAFDIINKAEEKSFEVCEICGKPGKLNNRGWRKVRCSEHNPL